MGTVRLNKHVSVKGVAQATAQDYDARHPRIYLPKEHVPGELVEGEGIFLGQWAPAYRNGKSLGAVFNAYAAPGAVEHLGGAMEFATMEGALEVLAKWYGHKGKWYAGDKALLSALRSGSYHGEWIVPPRELVDGYNYHMVRVQAGNLYDLRKTGQVAATIAARAVNWYWSCTEDKRERGNYMRKGFSSPGGWCVSGKYMQDGEGFIPVRLVPVQA